ncbi:MAG: FecR family protein [Sphingobacterium sp.]|jgi:ferric-dicitrate binding protein FerR (iron transport regulator)|nr:FecR family protein [Sphingobacterium sp.]
MNSNYKPSLELLAAYLSNRCNQEDKDKIDAWLSMDPKNGVYMDQLRIEWRYIDEEPIQLDTKSKNKIWGHVYKKLRPKPKVFVFNPKRFWYGTAAVALILLFLGGGIVFFIQKNAIQEQLQNQLTTIKTNTGQKSEVLLPDGSVVWLNAGSKISYHNTFNQNDRKVILEGEAFFDVKENENLLFVVETANLNVVVKGTAFDVSAYPEDKHAEVSLLRGKVDIQNKRGELVRKLLPNDLIRYDKEKNTYAFRQDNNAIQYSAWKNEELIFENESLDVVVKKLERWYGVEMDWEHAKSAKRYTFKVKTESLREMLQLINVITPLDYRIEGKQVTVRQR